MRFKVITEKRGGMSVRGAKSVSKTEYSANDALVRLSMGGTWAEDVDTGNRYDKETLARLIERAKPKKRGI